MEKLSYVFHGGQALRHRHVPVVVGVVGSGNLEVLVEQASLGGECHVHVVTAAIGFGAIWQAVLTDFFARHSLADVRFSINDVGATPAVVSLRLDQAVQKFIAGHGTGGSP